MKKLNVTEEDVGAKERSHREPSTTRSLKKPFVKINPEERGLRSVEQRPTGIAHRVKGPGSAFHTAI